VITQTENANNRKWETKKIHRKILPQFFYISIGLFHNEATFEFTFEPFLYSHAKFLDMTITHGNYVSLNEGGVYLDVVFASGEVIVFEVKNRRLRASLIRMKINTNQS